MNREDVIRLAKEAGIQVEAGNSFADDIYISVLYSCLRRSNPRTEREGGE
jgi:hypothetical protein